MYIYMFLVYLIYNIYLYDIHRTSFHTHRNHLLHFLQITKPCFWTVVWQTMKTMHNCPGENRTHHTAWTNSVWSCKPKDQHGMNEERTLSLLLQVFENQWNQELLWNKSPLLLQNILLQRPEMLYLGLAEHQDISGLCSGQVGCR